MNSHRNPSTNAGRKNPAANNYLHFVILFSEKISPRLRYITEFIGIELNGSAIQLTESIDEFHKYDGPRISYGATKRSDRELWIQPHELLFGNGIAQQIVDCFDWNGKKAFFKTNGDFPFDIFAAGFYLLSRYEEWLPHKKDIYGRYAHENSIAFKEEFLNLPIVNIWIEGLKAALLKKFPGFPSSSRKFQFLPTYDIDEGYCYLHKSPVRLMGGYMRSIMKGNWQEVIERKKVLRGQQDDPYDSFDFIKEIHEKKYPGLPAILFFLVAIHKSRYDKNIAPFMPPWKNRIREIFIPENPKLKAGIHPSWRSGDRPKLISQELEILEKHIGIKSSGSRQHYIRFNLPETFRQLIAAGITEDYSIGYGSINGFRASVASPFYWYDIEKEEKTSLLLHPFCFMDANSFYEQHQSAQGALDEMLHYYNVIKSVNGTMITIWHNTFLGTHKRFMGWREVYEEFLKEIDKSD